MSRTILRPVVLITALALLASFGCRRGKDDASPEPVTPQPTAGIESAGEFQLVGLVEQAFLGQGPDVDLPEGSLPGEEADVEGRGTSSDEGVMRVRIEAFSDPLRDQCKADEGEKFKVFWTASTRFDDVLLSGDIEQRLDGRRVGVIGRIFLRPEAGASEPLDQSSLGTDAPSATTSAGTATAPGIAMSEGETLCVLVAGQVGSSQGVLPTTGPAATTRPRTTTTPFPTRPPTPSATVKPTTTPQATTPPPATGSPASSPMVSP